MAFQKGKNNAILKKMGEKGYTRMCQLTKLRCSSTESCFIETLTKAGNKLNILHLIWQDIYVYLSFFVPWYGERRREKGG